jgi:hypothetical protein
VRRFERIDQRAAPEQAAQIDEQGQRQQHADQRHQHLVLRLVAPDPLRAGFDPDQQAASGQFKVLLVDERLCVARFRRPAVGRVRMPARDQIRRVVVVEETGR